MNLISFNPNFARILLLSTALVVSINIIAPRLKTKALLLMSVDRCEGKAEASGLMDVVSLNVDSKINGFVKMDLQKRAQEAALSGLLSLKT
jgi:hypothetical protein